MNEGRNYSITELRIAFYLPSLLQQYSMSDITKSVIQKVYGFVFLNLNKKKNRVYSAIGK